MTWKEFKASVEEQGVADETEMLSIEWDGISTPNVRSGAVNTVWIE